MRMASVPMKYLAAILVGTLILALAPGYREAVQAEGKGALARAVYITASKACACTLKRCQAADAVVAQVFSGARQRFLSRIDMATDEDAARPYIQKYRVFALPALLMLDTQGKLLWSAQGELDRDEVAFKLGELGG